MRTKKHKATGSGDLFRARLEQIAEHYVLALLRASSFAVSQSMGRCASRRLVISSRS